MATATRLNDLGQRSAGGGGRLDAPRLMPLDIIIREGFNYRTVDSDATLAHIGWLKESIRQQGIQKPVEVEFIDGKAYLVDGECRVRAAQALWNEGVEVFVPAMQVKGDEAEIRAKSMIANGALPPNQLEFGKAAAQLRSYGWDNDRIAAYTPPHIAQNKARAKRYVEDAIELHQAPLEVKEAVQKGVDGVKVSAALAVAATRHGRLTAADTIRPAGGQGEGCREGGSQPTEGGRGAKTKAKIDLLAIGDRMAAIVCDPKSLRRVW